MKKRLNKQVVLNLSERKNEPGWMTDFRLKALSFFEAIPNPSWGPDLSNFSVDDISYYVKPAVEKKKSWNDIPDSIKNIFEKLGIPQAEREILAGVGAQFESEFIYKSLKKEWERKGVIFSDLDTAVCEQPDLVEKYLSTIVSSNDNRFSALNSALWSGGSFLFVPSGVKIDQPLQTYFRMNSKKMGQFERTLIIGEPGSTFSYIEGCSAPVYRSNSLHSAVVEIIAKDKSNIRYSTVQNWSKNVYNLVTKRAHAYSGANIEWIDGNFGSGVTMKYPAILLKGEDSSGNIISISVAGADQQQDSGGKIIHLADRTRSNILSKSISKDGGCSTYRGLLKVKKGLSDIIARVQCDALILDEKSSSNTYPKIDIQSDDVIVGHEASVSSINEDQIWSLMSKGLSRQNAQTLIVNGFVDCFISELPIEYGVEINRLIELEMDDSVV